VPSEQNYYWKLWPCDKDKNLTIDFVSMTCTFK
jgi:hypothetical protein